MENIMAIRTHRRSESGDFESLLRPHVDHLFRVAFRFTGNREDAEDLVQDLLAKLYTRRREVAEVEKLRPWLVRVLYRMFVDDWRKRSRLRLFPGGEPEDPAASDPLSQLTAEGPDPREETESRLAREALEGALARLSPDHRAVLALHDIEGYTLPEMEAVLEVPVGTLKSRLHRARARLRASLGGEGTI